MNSGFFYGVNQEAFMKDFVILLLGIAVDLAMTATKAAVIVMVVKTLW